MFLSEATDKIFSLPFPVGFAEYGYLFGIIFQKKILGGGSGCKEQEMATLEPSSSGSS